MSANASFSPWRETESCNRRIRASERQCCSPTCTRNAHLLRELGYETIFLHQRRRGEVLTSTADSSAMNSLSAKIAPRVKGCGMSDGLRRSSRLGVT